MKRTRLFRQARFLCRKNGDGKPEAGDKIFSEWRLWRDSNRRNKISEPGEMHTMAESGIEAISLDLRSNKHRDQFGNFFRCEVDVYGPRGKKIGTVYNVILLPPR